MISKMRPKLDIWTVITCLLLLFFLVFFVYPIFGILRESVVNPDGYFTYENFYRFFSQPFFRVTLLNSFRVSIAITVVALLIGIPFSYFYSFYRLKGAKALFVLSVLCCMSAPFLGAYAWILLLGRSGEITLFLRNYLGINIGSIYGFQGILLVLSLQLFPLVFIYMNGAFKNIDNSLLEASANLGCTGVRRFFKVILGLSMPTVLAASLIVFMQAFSDFGTPLLIGEGFRTFPVEIYNQYLGEVGRNFHFASAISVIAIGITALVFFAQKLLVSRYKFSIRALHPVEKKTPKGIKGLLMHVYCYLLVGIAFLPQIYIVYLSFRNTSGAIILEGYSLGNYRAAMDRLLVRSIQNTLFMGVVSIIVIVVLSVLIAYLVVRRTSVINNTIDTMSILPFVMPGAVVGIALVVAFNQGPLVLTGTVTIMILALIIRRMPFTVRSSTATLMQIPMSIEEAAISLGSSKLKTFAGITVPMMSAGIISGAILSWVSIVTELASAIILYNNRTITLTMSAYVAITRGNFGLAAAFAAVLTVLTSVTLLIYLAISRSEDIRL